MLQALGSDLRIYTRSRPTCMARSSPVTGTKVDTLYVYRLFHILAGVGWG